MRAVLESVGVKDVLAKSKGSSNPHSVVKATINALVKMRDPYTIAQLRGIEMNKYLMAKSYNNNPVGNNEKN